MSCCQPPRSSGEGDAATSPEATATRDPAGATRDGAHPLVASSMVVVPATTFMMGNDGGGYASDGEGPPHEVQLSAFRISRQRRLTGSRHMRVRLLEP